MKRVFAYCRVSTAQQIEGDGFERQFKAIDAFCQRQGWTTLRPIVQEQHTGSDQVQDRPKLFALLERCGPETSDTIVIERIDRLGRELIVNELFFAECKKRGIKVYTADTGEEQVNAEADPTRVLIRQVLGALAQWNKSELVKKLQAGRRRKARETGEACGGFRRFGHAKDPEQAAMERKTIDFMTERRLRGASYGDIVFDLMQENILNPSGCRKWSRSTVQHILRQEGLS